MSRTLILSVTIFLTLALLGSAARADWPAQVFAPYTYLRNGDGNELMNAFNATGQKYFTMAFMNSEAAQPFWENLGPLTDHFYHAQIDAIRAKGGDVIMSFGGAAASSSGKELGTAEQDPAALAAKYQKVIDEYKLTWIDQDIEGKDLRDYTINHKRNTALLALQKANPGLIIAYTLPADPNGMNKDGVEALTDAKAQGLKVAVANVMTMSFGANFDRLGETMGQLSIDTVNASYKQCQAIDPDIKIGITPDVGGGGGGRGEDFTIPDTKLVLDFAKSKPWVRLIAFWELQTDSRTGGRGGRGGGAATQPATRAERGGRRGGAFAAGAVTQPSTRAGRRGRGGGGAGGAQPTTLATSGYGIPPAPTWGYVDLFRNFTTGFTPAQ